MNDNRQPGGFGMDNSENDNPNNPWSFEEPQVNNDFAPAFNADEFDPQKGEAFRKAQSSKKLGITGLVLSFVCCCLPVVGLVLGILAIVKASSVRKQLGGNAPSDATVGLVCGIIAIVLCGASMVYGLISTTLYLPTYIEEYKKALEQFSY